MSDVREYHELIVLSLKAVQEELKEIRAELKTMPSPDRVASLESEVKHLSRQLDKLSARLKSEERKTLAYWIRMAVYAGMFLLVTGIVATMAADVFLDDETPVLEAGQ